MFVLTASHNVLHKRIEVEDHESFSEVNCPYLRRTKSVSCWFISYQFYTRRMLIKNIEIGF